MPKALSDVSGPLPPFERPPQPDRSKREFRIKALMTLVAAAVVAGCASTNGSLAPRTAVASHGARDGVNISRALPAASPTPIPSDQAGCSAANGATCSVKKNAANPPSKTPGTGLGPADLRAAYGLPAAPSSGIPAGSLVAVVVAFDSPSAEADLGTYRTQYGLPACTSANGCFQKVQLKPTPGNPPPAPPPPPKSADGTTWSDERALDLAMVSAACPACRIMLVEAVGQDLDSLANAVSAAASYHPVAISNSWGVPEAGNVANIDAAAQAVFNQPGIAITASAGDLGTGQVQFPASSPYVTAVGGTTLTAAAGTARGWSEAEWIGSGDGCSIMTPLPAWQTAGGSCAGSRSVPDVTFLADSALGVNVYNTTEKGWVVLGGTSVGAPFVAGLYGAAADYGLSTVGAPKLYASLNALNPVPGTNGSPNGLAGF